MLLFGVAGAGTLMSAAHTGAVMLVDCVPYIEPKSPPNWAPAMPALKFVRGPPDVTRRIGCLKSARRSSSYSNGCVDTFRPAAAARTPTYSADAS